MATLAELMSGNTGIVAPGGSGTFNERVAMGIRAPTRSPEDERLLQDPAFREQYRQWVMSQGPGAGDWATPTGFQEWRANGGGFPMPTTSGGPADDDWFGQQGAPDGSGGAPGSATPWDEASFTQQFGTPRTPQELEALESRLNAAGIKVARNAAGVAGKIILPNGQYVDVINSAGIGGRGFQWLTGDGGGGAAGGIGAGLENTPGYQFRLGEGMKALERSAASRGTLLTGGTLKGLQRYAQDVASTEYGNRVNQLQNLSQLGLGAAGTQAQLGSNYASNAGTLLGNQATNTTNLLTGAGNAQAGGTLAGANAINQGIGGITNLAQMYYLSRLFGGQ